MLREAELILEIRRAIASWACDIVSEDRSCGLGSFHTDSQAVDSALCVVLGFCTSQRARMTAGERIPGRAEWPLH